MEKLHQPSESRSEHLALAAIEALSVVRKMTPIVRGQKDSFVGRRLDAERSGAIRRRYDEGLAIIDEAYHTLTDIFHDPQLKKESEAGCSFAQFKEEILISLRGLPPELQRELLLRDGTLLDAPSEILRRKDRVVAVSLSEFARCIRICTENQSAADSFDE